MEPYRAIARRLSRYSDGSAYAGGLLPSDGWHTYTQDQIALLDHLGVDRFAVAGMCIGGPYAMGLIAEVPERVSAAVLFQTIGLTSNRGAFLKCLMIGRMS